jgi:hypothetical protein
MNNESRLASLNGALRLETNRAQLSETVSTETLTMGAEAIDKRLQGGLKRAGLHKFYAAEPDDATATAGFALLLS